MNLLFCSKTHHVEEKEKSIKYTQQYIASDLKQQTQKEKKNALIMNICMHVCKKETSFI